MPKSVTRSHDVRLLGVEERHRVAGAGAALEPEQISHIESPHKSSAYGQRAARQANGRHSTVVQYMCHRSQVTEVIFGEGYKRRPLD